MTQEQENDLAKEYPRVVEQLLVEAEKARQDIGDYDRIGKNMRFYDPRGNHLLGLKLTLEIRAT